jgi:hypothetical protein
MDVNAFRLQAAAQPIVCLMIFEGFQYILCAVAGVHKPGDKVFNTLIRGRNEFEKAGVWKKEQPVRAGGRRCNGGWLHGSLYKDSCS